MNKKGFTLIELLAIIVIIGIIAVVVAPSVINSYTGSKERAYRILVDNIKLAGENYYKECEFGTLSECKDPSGTITTTIGNLAKNGLLKGSAESTDGEFVYEYKTVKNPKTGKCINGCSITITKNVESNSKTTFEFGGLDLNSFSSCEKECNEDDSEG